MMVWRLRGVVVVGESLVKGRAGIGGEKRMMRKRGDVILAVGGLRRGKRVDCGDEGLYIIAISKTATRALLMPF